MSLPSPNFPFLCRTRFLVSPYKYSNYLFARLPTPLFDTLFMVGGGPFQFCGISPLFSFLLSSYLLSIACSRLLSNLSLKPVSYPLASLLCFSISAYNS